MIALLTPLVSLATQWFEGHQKKQEAKVNSQVIMEQAKAEVMRKQATLNGDWDLEALRGQGSSWKDEWFTVVLSLPFLGAFIPAFQPYVKEGFVILEGLPDWYKAALGIAIAASFGIRSFATFFKRKWC